MTRRTSTEDDYTARIDRVLDHIQTHPGEALALRTLARLASFSPFHFHRVFKAHTGETVREHVERVRTDRAALLLGRAGARTRLVDVALSTGLGSAAAFSRVFRARFGVTPTQFRARAQTSKIRQEPADALPYLAPHVRRPESERAHVALVRRTPRHVAYVRVQSPFSPGRLTRAQRRLDTFARAHALDGCECAGISLDDPELVPAARCRYDLALVTPLRVRATSGVSSRTLAGGTYAELAVRGSAADVAHAWEALFRFLPSSGYEPANGPAIELYRAAPDFETWTGFDVVLGLPVARTRGR